MGLLSNVYKDIPNYWNRNNSLNLFRIILDEWRFFIDINTFFYGIFSIEIE